MRTSLHLILSAWLSIGLLTLTACKSNTTLSSGNIEPEVDPGSEVTTQPINIDDEIINEVPTKPEDIKGDTPKFNGEVKAFEPLEDGSIIISGDFTEYYGEEVPGIVKIDKDGNIDKDFLDKFKKSHLNNVTEIIENKDGTITLVGDITNFNSQPVDYSATLTPEGELTEKQIPLTSSKDTIIPLESGETLVSKDPQRIGDNKEVVALLDEDKAPIISDNEEGDNSQRDPAAKDLNQNYDPEEEIESIANEIIEQEKDPSSSNEGPLENDKQITEEERLTKEKKETKKINSKDYAKRLKESEKKKKAIKARKKRHGISKKSKNDNSKSRREISSEHHRKKSHADHKNGDHKHKSAKDDKKTHKHDHKDKYKESHRHDKKKKHTK